MDKAALPPIAITLNNEQATRELGADIAMAVSGGCTIHLRGDLGAGKSTFARAFIRQILRMPEMEVPSPTFSLVQHYQVADHKCLDEILHADLYRIGNPDEVVELGLEQCGDNTIFLVEWPEKGSKFLAEPDLVIDLLLVADADGRDYRTATIFGAETHIAPVQRSLNIRRFLMEAWGDHVNRTPLQGDASSRSYEFVSKDGVRRILMNAPKQPDGPVIREGKPYSQIAHLAEDVSAFVGVASVLKTGGLRVPAIYNQAIAEGLLLIEDLGSDLIIDEHRQPIAERYLASASMLADFHERNLSGEIPIETGFTHTIPDYDREAMLVEVELLAKWYAPRFKGAPLSEEETAQFSHIWNGLVDLLSDSEQKVLMRDFHSPNIIWRNVETGHHKVAVIDFQDAVIGPSAYDLASLAQDARVDVSGELEETLVDHYCSLRKAGAGFDENRFRRDYAIMAALRTTKILGIFVRLDERDNKPDYLRHLPRMQEYIRRAMRHPVLKEYRGWYETVMELQ